jgi:hypothetical protein
MEQARQALKKLNVFAQMHRNYPGNRRVLRGPPRHLSDGIFGVAMTLLILDVRLPDDFRPRDGAELLQGLVELWPKFLPYC